MEEGRDQTSAVWPSGYEGSNKENPTVGTFWGRKHFPCISGSFTAEAVKWRNWKDRYHRSRRLWLWDHQKGIPPTGWPEPFSYFKGKWNHWKDCDRKPCWVTDCRPSWRRWLGTFKRDLCKRYSSDGKLYHYRKGLQHHFSWWRIPRWCKGWFWGRSWKCRQLHWQAGSIMLLEIYQWCSTTGTGKYG